MTPRLTGYAMTSTRFAMRHFTTRLTAAAIALTLLVSATSAFAQSRFLGKEEIQVLGLGLKVEPAVQTVPKGFATIVSTFLQGSSDPNVLPPFAPDAEVRATLRGPSFAQPINLVAAPNTPFQIPLLTVAGTHTLENIRLVSGGEVVLYGTPETARIEVIDKLLVTTVTARPLTAAEIREKGIVFDKDNFQAYNFTAAFAIDDGSKIDIQFPVVLPTLVPPKDVQQTVQTLQGIDVPVLRGLQTIIPDTLRIQARIPNLSVVGFTLKLDQQAQSQDFYVPPIPGVIVIPGDIGFLNQFFSVMLMVANVAPEGSNLVVTELSASIVLPPGKDNVVGSLDDPLAMARRAGGETPRMVQVTRPGPDGILGNGDDLTSLGPQQTGNAEFLVEGRREGTHVVEMELAGTLNGLPVGPVPVRGRAAGVVLVRNPTFTLTFTHPDVVNVGEPYTLDVTVTNTSESPANFVSINLFAPNISGARLDDEPSKAIESIAPGDSATVTYRLISNRTGKVTAATLDSDEQVAGRFQLKTAIGELGVPLSPDSLVLPKEAASLPEDLRAAALGLLGRAWAVATAPPAALPKDLTRFSKQVVLDRAIETAEAGFRLTLGESLPSVAANLLMDYLGSEYTDLSRRVPQPDTTGLLGMLQKDVQGFDLVRRKSVRSDVVADVIGKILRDDVIGGPAAYHAALAEQFTSRPGHVSVLLSAGGSTLPVDGVLVDGAGRRTGPLVDGKVLKDIPFSDVVTIKSDGGAVIAQLFIVAVPEVGDYTVRLARRAGESADASYDVSVAYPLANGRLRFASINGVGPTELPTVQHAGDDPTKVLFALAGGGTPTAKIGIPGLVTDPAPTALGVVQMANADIVGCTADELGRVFPAGRVVAVLFSEEVTPESVQDKLAASAITAFLAENNRVVGVALQPGGRVAFLALREPVGPFIARTLSVNGIQDRAGQVMAAVQTLPIVTTVPADIAGQVSGRVLNADGTAAAFSSVRLFYEFVCSGNLKIDGIAEETTDAEGRYAFDYVLNVPGMTVKLAAIDTERDELRIVKFRLARPGQHLNVDVVLLGRATLRGRTLAEDGTPLAGTALRITSSTDQSQYAATSDANGVFEVGRIPVGNVLIEAVHVDRAAQVFVSEHLPFAGAVVNRDITLLDVDTTPLAMKKGSITGRVVRSDGVTAVAGVPVVAYYKTRSQAGLPCPKRPNELFEPAECAIAVATTGDAGTFAFPSITAGEIRLNTFDQVELMEGNVRVAVAADSTIDATILLAGGFGTVNGVVLDASGSPVPDAVVGGGLSLANVNADGTFTLTDVPVGRRKLVAVSEALGAKGETTIDIVQQGETVNATIVLQPIGAVTGIVRNFAGVPQAGIKVWVFVDCYDEFQQPSICIRGEAVTDQVGAYRIEGLPIGTYTVSAFRGDMKDGNLNTFAIRYNRQVLINDITFRGGFGTVKGRVLRACAQQPCGDTPLPAKVGISGYRLVAAGGKIGVRFEYVQNYGIVDNNFTTGEYAFNDVWVGPFTVRAAGQFSPEPVAVEGTMPGPDQTVTVDIRLMPTSRITGTVYESDGFTPVTNRQIAVNFKSNAVVVFCSEDDFGFSECQTIPQGIQEYPAATDENGRFSFPIVNAGPFTITATDQATGKIGEIQGSVRAGDTVDVSLRLLSRSDVTVRVFRSDGFTPVANASVELQQIDYPKARRTGIALDGTVQFAGGDALSEGQFAIVATGPGGFAGRATGRVTADGTAVTVDVFIADNTGTVVGQVFKEDANAGLVNVANAEVVLSNNSGPIAITVSDASGQFSIPLVPTGPFTIEAFDPTTAARGRANGTVFGGAEPAAVSVRLEPLGSIRGTVVQSGVRTPLKGWTVTLSQVTPAGRSLPQQMAQTGVDGSFTFPGSSVGTFSLRATHRDTVGQGSASGTITIGGQLVDVPIVVNIVRRVTGRVTGFVALPGGLPAANAQVEVCGAGDPCRATTAGGDGRFFLNEVPLGRFTVRASAQVSGNPSVGTTGGTVLFDGDTADVTVTLLGLSVIQGTVYELVNNVRQPAANASVRLYGQPGSGCPGVCQRSTDSNGNFQFINVPAHTFTVSATGFNNQQGSVGGSLIPGETKSGLEIVLAPAVSLTGRVLDGEGTPAGGVVAELTVSGTVLFAETDATGVFAFESVKAGAYTLKLQDPIGGGIARRVGTIVVVSGAIDLGDIALDEAAPMVVSSVPELGAVGVSRTPEIRVTFSERVAAATVNAATLTLIGPNGAVGGQIDMLENDTVGRFRLLPGVQLQDQARYTIKVIGVTDLAGRVMAGDFTASFMTVDVTPPTILETTPLANASGTTIDTTIRVKYSEIIDTSRFAGPAITLTGPGGAIAGRLDYAFSNTLAIFTPDRPLDEDTVYTVRIARATDLTGQQQGSDTQFQFSTTDRTPPVVTALVASNNGQVIENSTATVTATVSPSDVAVVDFYINDVFAFADRAVPFALTLQAAPQFGAPGSRIKVSAIAVDTSGNRGVVAVNAFLDVIADTPPAVTITQPVGEITAPGGQRIDVQVQASDDLGLTQISYLVRGAVVIDAATRPVSPAAPSRSESFSFNVPANALPGSIITIEASAVDTAAHTRPATPVTIRVLDSVGPAVQITGLSSGQRVRPGQDVTVVVQADDPGLLTNVGLEISGVVTRTEQRPINPPRASVATTFVFTVPAGATSLDSVTLRAFAIDVAGNRGNSAQTTLPVADQTVPTVTVRTADNTFDVPAGRVANIVVTGVDDVAIASLRLTATGPNGFSFDDTRGVPPVSPASFTFAVPIPESMASGDQIVLTGRAVDASGNDSAPTSITVTVRHVDTVTLPASLSLDAGTQQGIEVTIGAAAPAGGTQVDLVSRNTNVARVSSFVRIAEGQTTATAMVDAVAGGTTQIDALIGGVQRQTMTVTVAGGIVRGTVVKMAGEPPVMTPVAEAQVTVFHAGTPLVTTTAGDGTFSVAGVQGAGLQGRDFSVRATDGTLLGFLDSTLTVANGSADVSVLLIAAGSIDGVVNLADGVTRVGAGVKVELFEGASPSVVIATAFTDANGQFVFPLAAPGPYRVDAADQSGNRGRAELIVLSGANTTVPINFIGRGTVTGLVRSGAGTPVANAQVELHSSSIFGSAAVVTASTNGEGRFSFANVYVGNVTVQARDLGTGQAGTANGQITTNGGTLDLTVTLSSYGNLQGTVRRVDGLTVAPAAQVTVRMQSGAQFNTTTDQNGRYAFTFLPFQASYTVTVRDPGTRGLGSALGGFTVSGETVTTDVTLLPQGALLVSVVDANGNPINGATVSAQVTLAPLTDSLQGVTANLDGLNGRVLLDKLLAGPFTVNATASGLSGSVTGTLAANDVHPVTVTLEPTATIRGDVLDQDGQTPAAGTVRVYRNGNHMTTVPLVNGHYTLDVRLGNYSVAAYDAANRLRATSENFTLTSNGEIATQDMTFVALGTVSGRVIHAIAGGDVNNLLVQARSLHPMFGGFFSDRTDPAGNYVITGVPVGLVTVTSTKASEQLIGEASGALVYTPPAPAELSLDIQLRTNAVSLPTSLADGNGTLYGIGAGGGLTGSTGSTFNYDGGGLVLDITPSGGSAQRFTGAGFGTYEDGNREIAVRQNGLAGLNVTRKIYVPTTGYFSRHLEVLTNPTAAPITVDVLLSSRIYGGRSEFCSFQCERTQFLSKTSSGDNVIDVTGPTPDRWMSFGGGFDPFGNSFYHAASVAFVLGGDNAPVPASTATWTNTNPNVSPFLRPLVTVGWQAITVQPGQSVALMHFVSLQAGGPDPGSFSSERLVQLPPEALDGLSPEEIAEIRNFVVPANGVSALPALPGITGAVSGRVLEGDGVSIVPNTNVTLQSTLPYYPRRLVIGVNAAGQFAHAGVPGAPLPVADFTMFARHPVNQFRNSPTTTAAFPAGQGAVVHDVVFNDGGILTGVVRRPNGTPVVGARVEIPSYATAITDGSGRYRFGGIIAGNVTLRGVVPRTQGDGTDLVIVQQVVALAVGQVRDDVLLIENAGGLTGVLTNAAGVAVPAGRQVTFTHADGQFTRTASTDSQGRYNFTDLRAGAGTLRSVNPDNQFPVTKAVTVLTDQLVTENLAYQGNITLSVLVTRANGTPLQGMGVRASGTGFNVTGTTGADGVAQVANVPFGQVTTVEATHPSLPSVLRNTAVFTSSGSTPQIVLALPAFGTVTGEVTRPNDTPAGFGTPIAISGNNPNFSFSTQSAADSRYSFTAVPAGQTFTLTTTKMSTSFSMTTTGILLQDAQVLTVNTHYPAVAQITITVTENGVAQSGIVIQERMPAGNNVNRGTTNALGVLVVPSMTEGVHNFRALRNGVVTETATVTVPAGADGGNVNLPIEIKRFTISVRGTIRDMDGQAMHYPYSIVLLRANDRQQIATTCVGGQGNCARPLGEFLFTQFNAVTGSFNSGNGEVTGAGVVVQVNSPFMQDTPPYEVTVVPTANGEHVADFNLPLRRATVQGRVLAADGVTPVGLGYVSPNRVTEINTRTVGSMVVNPDGTWTTNLQYMPPEGLRLKLWGVQGVPNALVQAVSGPITQTGQVLSVDLVLPSDTIATKITGLVVAGDGVTPLESASVDLTTTQGNCCTAYTNAQGEFSFNITVPLDGQVTLRARANINNSPAVMQALSVTQQGATLDAGTLVVPVSVLRGRVTFGGTAPAPDVTVMVKLGDQTLDYLSTNHEGRFQRLGLAAGTYTLIAQHYQSGNSVETTATIVDGTSSVSVDLDLPPVGTVIVRVFDRNGQRVMPTNVVLTYPNGLFESYCGDNGIWPDNNQCTYEFVPMGAFHAQAELETCDEFGDNCHYTYAVGTTSIDSPGQTGIIDIRFDQLRQVEVELDPDWMSYRDLSDGDEVRITVRAMGANGPLGSYFVETFVPITGGPQTVTFDDVPPGRVVVMADRQHPDGWWDPLSRVEDVTSAAPNQPLVIQLASNQTWGGYWYGLAGADNWYYWVDDGGKLPYGGRLEGDQFNYTGAFNRINDLRIYPNTTSDGRVPGARTLAGATEVTSGPFPAGVAYVTRKAWVPPSGGFARYLDVYTNDTAVPLTVTPDYLSDFEGIEHTLVQASVTTGSSIVYANNGPGRATAGVVWAGVNAPVKPIVGFNGFDDFAFFDQPIVRQTITIPPFSSVSLLHFAVMRLPNQGAQVSAQVAALVGLTEPNALTGLTAAELASIVNFSFTRIRGQVLASDGVSVVGGARVQLKVGGTQCVGCEVFADAEGRFEIVTALPAGALTVTITPAITGATPVTVPLTTAPENGVIDAGGVQIAVSVLRGRVTFGVDTGAPSTTVTVRRNGSTVRTVNTTDNGDYVVVGLGPGSYDLTARHSLSDSTATGTATIADGNSAVTVDMAFPPARTVVVRVFDENGSEIEPGRVSLSTPAGSYSRLCGAAFFIKPNAAGECTFDFVPAGDFLAQAEITTCDGPNCRATHAIATGNVAGPGSTLTLEPNFANHGRVYVTTDENWVSQGKVAVGNTIRVTVRPSGANGPMGGSTRDVNFTATAGTQEVEFGVVPPGPVVVTAERFFQGRWHTLARMHETLPHGRDSALDLFLSTSAPVGSFAYPMKGSDNWQYNVGVSGHIESGWLDDGGDQLYGLAFTQLNHLTVNGQSVWDARGLTTETNDDGDEKISMGPFQLFTAASVTRQLYVPHSGEFVRYLDEYSNDTDVPVTITAVLRSFSTTTNLRDQVLPSSDSPGALVWEQPDEERASLGMTFAGENAPVTPVLTFNGNNTAQPVVTTTFTIPPHSKRSILSFFALRDPWGGVIAAEQVIDRIGYLDDREHVLKDLTQEERASVINFNNP